MDSITYRRIIKGDERLPTLPVFIYLIIKQLAIYIFIENNRLLNLK